MGGLLGGLPLEMVGRCLEHPAVDCCEATVDAAAEGSASPGSPLSVGLSSWEPLVGNWSRVKHLIEG